MHGLSTSRDDFNMLFDAVHQAEDRLRVIRTLRKQRAAKLHTFEKTWIDGVMDTATVAIAGIAQMAEPVPEPIESRRQRLHDVSLPLLLRLKGLISNSSPTTQHFAQLSIVTESLDNAMDVLSSCEARNPTAAAAADSSSSELCEFINHRRLANTDRCRPTVSEPLGPVVTVTPSDISGRNKAYTNDPSRSQPSFTTSASATVAGRSSQRDSIEVMNAAETCRATSHAGRTGWVLKCGTCSEPAMSVTSQQSKYDLPVMIEEAGIWRQSTESAFNTAAQQDHTYRDQRTPNRMYRSRLCTCQEHDRFESLTGSGIHKQKGGASRKRTDVHGQSVDAVAADFDHVPKGRLTDTGRLQGLLSPRQVHHHVQKDWTRRRSLPTMMPPASSPQFPGSALPSIDCGRYPYGTAVYDSDQHRPEDATNAMVPFSSTGDSDKEVVSPQAPTLISTLSNNSVQTMSLRTDSSVSLFTNGSEIGSRVTITESAPSHGVTRGRALLEDRARSQP